MSEEEVEMANRALGVASTLLDAQRERIMKLEAALEEIIDCERIPQRERAESVATIARAALERRP